VSLLSALDAAREGPARDALVLPSAGLRLTFADVAARVSRAAGHLDTLGLPRGARVALTARCQLDVVIAVLALIELGFAVVPLHPRLTPAEIAVQLAEARPARVLSDADVAALADPGPTRSRGPSPPDDAPLAILFTSGTTGRPKGAVLARSAFLASAAASAENLGFVESDRWLLCLPLAHAGGLSILTRCLAARRAVVLEERFEPDACLAAIRDAGVSIVSVVPTMLRALLAADRGGDLARLRVALVGGAAAPLPLLEESARLRVPALTTYGLTEACSQLTTQAPRDPSIVDASAGSPLRGADVEVVDDAGEALPAGREGRIRARGPMLMSGYLGHAPLGAAPFDTGDLGYRDERGRLFVLSRRTDLVVSGGENVYPAEVEAALLACPGVAAALVFGVPDEVWGQVVAAAIVPAESGSFDRQALRDCLSARLARYKRPRLLAVVPALPETRFGKPDRVAAGARLRGALEPLP
jgi:O-succinylbenzoic acid--CoA ligase